MPAGTYNTTKSYAASTYSLTIVGVTGAVPVRLITNASTIREVTSTANGGTATVNVDGTGTNGTHQLRYMLADTTNTTRGMTIWCRDGYLDPAATGIRFRPAASYTGSGVITIRSETVDTTISATGEPNRKHGFKISSIQTDTTNSGDVETPIVFKDIWFEPDVAGFTGNLLRYNSTKGWGMSLDGCRFSLGAAVTSTSVGGVDTHGGSTNGSYVKNCTFTGVNKAITLTKSDAGGLYAPVITNNYAFAITEDFCGTDGYATNVVFEDNFGRDFKARTGDPHADFLQDQGNVSGSAIPYGSVKRNIYVHNEGVGTAGCQGIFFRGSTSPMTGIDISNNIFIMKNQANGIFLANATDPKVLSNTIIRHPEDAGSKSQIYVPDSSAGDIPGTGGQFTNNFTNQVNIAPQGGSPTTTPNYVVSLNSLANYQAAMPGFVASGIYTREQAIVAATPLVDGPAKNVDGSYNGALLPDGNWNIIDNG